jgi:hypothetical protein
MRPFSFARIATASWLVSACAASASIGVKPDDPYTNEGETQTYTVNADGSYAKLDSMTLHVNNEAGVARVAQQYIWFNRNMADVQIIEAYTTGADGVRHDVQPEQIRDVQEARSFDAPMFQDIQEKVIVFPAVEPGSRVHLTYRKTQKVPIVAGEFSDFTPPDLAPTHNFRLIYDLPADKPLYADARGFTAKAPVTSAGRTRYEFRYDRAHFSRLEHGSVAYVSYGDRLMVSTFASYGAFAATYRASSADPSAHDAALVQLARSVAPKPRRCTTGSGAMCAMSPSMSDAAPWCRTRPAQSSRTATATARITSRYTAHCSMLWGSATRPH